MTHKEKAPDASSHYHSYTYDTTEENNLWSGYGLVGSSKILVSFAEYGLCYSALLQKRPIILRSLLVVATPYHSYPYDTTEENDV